MLAKKSGQMNINNGLSLHFPTNPVSSFGYVPDVTGVKKGHDLMNQNLPSFPCLRIITSIMSFYLILSTYATSSSVWNTQCQNFEMNILKLEYV